MTPCGVVLRYLLGEDGGSMDLRNVGMPPHKPEDLNLNIKVSFEKISNLS